MRVCAVVLAALCAAYPAGRAGALDAGDEAYDAAIAAAVQHYRDKNWTAARAAFERAHDLRPSARTFRGLGLSAYYANDDVAAASALESALEDSRNALDSGQRVQVSELLQRIRGRIAHVFINAKPDTVTIRVDGAAVARDRGQFMLPGKHSLLVSAPGFVDYREDFDVAGGQQMSLRIVLEPNAKPTPPPVAKRRAVPVVPPADERPERGSARSSPFAPWILAAAGAGVAALVSLGFALTTQEELDQLQQRCDRVGCTPETRDRMWAESPIETYESLTNVALAAALAGTAASVTLFVTLESSDQPGPASSRVTPFTVVGARVSGRF